MQSAYALFGILVVMAFAGLASAATPGVGQDQYWFLGSCNGYIHGAFANTNGDFGFLGTAGYSSVLGGGVPVAGSTGYNNAHASAYCKGQ